MVAALLSLAGATHVAQIVTATLVLILVFGFLDVMYLATEVAYRDLYARIVDAIRSGDYGKPLLFEAKASPDAGCVIWALGSWSELPYYALIVSYVIAELARWPAYLAR